jgi:hypothetical protein
MSAARWVAAVAAVLSLVACDLQPSAPATPTASATVAPSVTVSATPTPASHSPSPTPSPTPTRTPTRTPTPAEDVLAGRTNPAVTQATVHSTICVSGYTATIRPPWSVTSKVKAEMAAEQHVSVADVILDHVVPLEGGGAPGSLTDHRNFMLQPRAQSYVKDRLEDEMRDDICSGRVPLHTAQVAMADGWQDYAQQVGDR